MPENQVGQPVSLTSGDVRAQGFLAAGSQQIRWRNDPSDVSVDPSIVRVVPQAPAGQAYAFVVSNTAPADLGQSGLSNVSWERNASNLPEPQGGQVYQPPSTLRGIHVDLPLIGKVGFGDTGDRGLNALGIPTALSKAAGPAPIQEGRYVTPGVPALVGKAPIPAQDPATGLVVRDSHNHPNSFAHPNYLRFESFANRLVDGLRRGLINGRDVKVQLSYELIPYLTQAQGGAWLGYTAPEAQQISSQFAHRDDWKMLQMYEQLQKANPELANLFIPSLTGIETYPISSPDLYGSKLDAHQYIGRVLLNFPTIDPIAGELNGRKEIKSVKDGRTDLLMPMSALTPGRTGTYLSPATDTVMGALQDAGMLSDWHNDWGQFELGRDGQAIGAPSDARDFFHLMHILMQHGSYDLSGYNFSDPNFILSDNEIRNIVAKGPDPKKLSGEYIIAHFGIGNYERASVEHLALLRWAINHPLLQHVSFDSSWLPSLEAVIAKPQYLDAMTEIVRSGRIVYGGDVTNFQTAEQLLAPWYLQQPLLKNLEQKDPAALIHYAGGGFSDAYNRSLPKLHYARWRYYHAPEFQDFISKMPGDRWEALNSWISNYEAAHPEVRQGRVPKDINLTWPISNQNLVLPAQAPNPEVARAIYQIVHDQTQPQTDISDLFGLSQTQALVTPPNTTPANAPALPPGPSPSDQDVRNYMGEEPMTRTELGSLISISGKPYAKEAVDAAAYAAQTGADRYLQLVTLVGADLVQNRQETLDAFLQQHGKTQVAKVATTLAATSLVLATLGVSGVVGSANSADLAALVGNLGQIGNATRSGILLGRVLNQQTARKLNEAIQEQGIVTPEMINSIQRRVQQLGPNYGLARERFTGPGSSEEVFNQFVTDVAYFLGTPVDVAAGETQDARHATLQAVASGFIPQIDRAAGISWTSLEPTNFRTTSGAILAALTAVAYDAGAVSNAHNVMHYGLDVRAIPYVAVGLANTLFSAYQATGAVSGAFHENWADHPNVRKAMVYGAWPTLAAGTWGLAGVNLYNAIADPGNGFDKVLASAHGNLPWLTHTFPEAALLGIAAAAVTHLASMGVRQETNGGGVSLPRRNPQATAVAAVALILLAAVYFWKKFEDAQISAANNKSKQPSATPTPSSP